MKLITPNKTNLPATGYRAIIIGDAMVDTYLDCQPVGISDEAPVTVLDWRKTTRTFGGMLNTAKSLRTLGFDTHAFGIVNENDEAGAFIDKQCKIQRIHQHWVSDHRPTTEKTRIGVNLDKHASEHIARIDVEHDNPLDEGIHAQLHNSLESILNAEHKEKTVVIISDYMKGTINKQLANWLVKNCNDNKIPILVDAKPKTLDWYAGANLLTPNEKEARAYLLWKGVPTSDHSTNQLQNLAATLTNELHSNIILTVAEKGVYLAVHKKNEHQPISVRHFEANTETPVLSTSGAGDVFIAMMALSVTRGESWEQGISQAQNMVASAISRRGTCAIEAGDWSEDCFSKTKDVLKTKKVHGRYPN